MASSKWFTSIWHISIYWVRLIPSSVVITWIVLLRLLRMFPSMSGIALPVPPEYSPTSTLRNSYMRDTPRRISEMYHTCGLRVGDHVEVLLDAFLLWDEQVCTCIWCFYMFLHVYGNVYQQILEFRIITVYLPFSVVLTDIRISWILQYRLFNIASVV